VRRLAPGRARAPALTLVLAGQPNCGKSTLFNEVAGYRSVASNFPGATVSYTRGEVRLLDRTVALADLPGVYSLTSFDPASRETQKYLLSGSADVIVNVVDASVLPRSLELTLQLLELEKPLVVCLNMMDEAERKGIRVDPAALSLRLGVPVVPCVASRGRGVRRLFGEAIRAARRSVRDRSLPVSRDVERVIQSLHRRLAAEPPGTFSVPPRLLAVKLLENDPDFLRFVPGAALRREAARLRRRLQAAHGRTADAVIAAERHALSMDLAESSSRVEKPARSWRDRLDDALMHPVWGYACLAGFLWLFFQGVFRAGTLIEGPLLEAFARISVHLSGGSAGASPWGAAASGALLGVGGGIAVVVPFLVPFLFGLAFLEDAGYLPRVAFLLDAFMHRIGLHGIAVIPAVMGYGCNVPAVMAVRILESPRDRFIASVIASGVPCSARMVVVFGLVGAAFGPLAAFGVYALNLAVLGAAAAGISRLLPEAVPGMLLEIPALRLPALRSLWVKTWLRLKDFVFYAWPLLIAGSALLAVLQALGGTDPLNGALRPLTAWLGLPRELGLPLVFGLLRKELSLIMLSQALGSGGPLHGLTPDQAVVYTVFVVFYVPCLGTLGVLWRQIGRSRAAIVTGLSLALSLVVAGAVRFALAAF
jgi:ferrous iron transport protein B